MYCPKCLPYGPKAAGTDPATGQPLDPSQRYACEKHHQSANLRPLGNGFYECHCGWNSESQRPIGKAEYDSLVSRVVELEAKLGKVK